MDLLTLKHQIIKDELSNFYIFVGEEIGIENIYLQQIGLTTAKPIVRADSVIEVYGKCTTKTLFGSSDAIYAIRNDTDFMKQEKLHATIKRDIKNNIIILMYDKLDSRTKFSKTFKDCTVEFNKLSRMILRKYIKKRCTLRDNYCDILMDICGDSYDLCMLECDKIYHYSCATGKTDENSMKMLVESGVIYQPEETDVFEFVDTVCMHKTVDAFYLENILRQNNIQSINILGTLYNTLKNILLIQVCESKDISGVTGLDSKVVYFNKKYVNKYSSEKLVQTIKLIIKVVSDIKNGRISDSYAVRYILVNLM